MSMPRSVGPVLLAIWAATLPLKAQRVEVPRDAGSVQSLSNGRLQVTVPEEDGARHIRFAVKIGTAWVNALDAANPVLVRGPQGMKRCAIVRASAVERRLLVEGDCGAGTFEQRISLTPETDVLHVSTRLRVHPGTVVHSVEDRYSFMPERHAKTDEHTGPLDFVWSQNIKSEAADLIPSHSFKSPAVMMQQGAVFAALMPDLDERHVETRAMDLDVTSELRPWMSFGAIPSEPHGHSYFRRAADAKLTAMDDTVAYSYSLVLSAQPERTGYRRVVRRLWEQTGRPELLGSAAEQQNVLRPELRSFATWREEAWGRYADRVYLPVPCAHGPCGTLENHRAVNGDWENGAPDAWFNAWFQSLRTAYGWYLHGRKTQDRAMMAKAESVLNLALSSPQKQGVFSTIFLLNGQRWVPGDGWASYGDSYHSFSMSWTAYWMLRWAADLTPERKAEVLAFVRPYGEFLLAHQATSGVIPSWYEAGSLQPRPEFRDFNAETAASALLLVALSQSTGERRYLAGAERAMEFVTREVLPRQRWFDYETFLSCARKDFSFFDAWTAQYPQNNLAEMQAVQAMLSLSQATGKAQYLRQGVQMLDYLLLTQQVWNTPEFTPQLLGGFTTQNTDNEWSDARQAYAATLLHDYYRATGDVEYLERAVAAARSTFAVAPWENWAHTGYVDEPGAMTGFHWGTGSAMTTVEMMQPELGDAFIDLQARAGTGFDECSVTEVRVEGDAVSFDIASPAKERSFLVRFGKVDPSRVYRLRWNSGPEQRVIGADLQKKGWTIGPLAQPKQEAQSRFF